jgi:hypothetical protein
LGFNLQNANISPLQSKHYWVEIDLLRAFAAVLMVVNHSGVAWFEGPLGQPHLAMEMTFVGSLAPVLFFFATGLGAGVQAVNLDRHQPLSKTITKVLILLFADAAMWLSTGRFWGLDFLGFIALSTLVIDLIYRSSYPRILLVAGIISALILRFVVAPTLKLPSDGIPNQAIHFVMGDIGLQGFSYLLCPWIAFPFLGALIGDVAGRCTVQFQNLREKIAFIMCLSGLVGLGLCLYLDQIGMVFFRWGTLSFAYTLFAVASLCIAIALTLFITLIPTHSLSPFALPGVASLIVVPVHYVLVAFAGWFIPMLVQQVFPIASIATAFLAIYLSKLLNRIMTTFVEQRLWEDRNAVLITVSCASLATCTLASKTQFQLLAMVFSQLFACILFIRSARKKSIHQK